MAMAEIKSFSMLPSGFLQEASFEKRYPRSSLSHTRESKDDDLKALAHGLDSSAASRLAGAGV
jgi:hypothetical protein